MSALECALDVADVRAVIGRPKNKKAACSPQLLQAHLIPVEVGRDKSKSGVPNGT